MKNNSITLKKISSSDVLFPEILKLYCSAFPAEERRDDQGLKQQIAFSGCMVMAIKQGEFFVGLCIYWKFSDFVFIEHFAIKPELRGRGIGEETLILMRKLNEKPIVLEVEPAADDLSIRRIAFYQRNGFHMLDTPYMQPSYDFISPDLPLNLMCTQCSPDKELIQNWITQIHRWVYGRGI